MEEAISTVASYYRGGIELLKVTGGPYIIHSIVASYLQGVCREAKGGYGGGRENEAGGGRLPLGPYQGEGPLRHKTGHVHQM